MAKFLTEDDVKTFMVSRCGDFYGEDPLSKEEWERWAELDKGEWSLPTLLNDGRRGLMFMDELVHTECDEEDLSLERKEIQFIPDFEINATYLETAWADKVIAQGYEPFVGRKSGPYGRTEFGMFVPFDKETDGEAIDIVWQAQWDTYDEFYNKLKEETITEVTENFKKMEEKA